MLYDPKWEAQPETKADPLSVEAFIAWLETKDPDITYDYTSSTDCLYVRFVKEATGVAHLRLGPRDIPARFHKIVHPFYGAGFFREIWRSVTRQSYERRRGWTYGDALRRAQRS